MVKLRCFYCPWPLHSTCTICKLNKVWCSMLPSLYLPHARAFPSKLTVTCGSIQKEWVEGGRWSESVFGNFTKDFLVSKLNKVVLTDGGSILINALISIKLLCETADTCKLTCFGKSNKFYTHVTGIASESYFRVWCGQYGKQTEFYNTNNRENDGRLHCYFFPGGASVEVLRAVLTVLYKTIAKES